MAKTWYPVVDYSICEECGTCVSKCPHGVYDTKKKPTPVVRNPLSCVDHCHGCGNRCPVGAITYVGDDTGWTPPHGSKTAEECAAGCSCGCGKPSEKKVKVEYLYLDLSTCERCKGTDNVLDEVMMTLTPALVLAGYEVEYNKIEMSEEGIAEKYKFLSSPTIRVNGCDVCTSVRENSCGCCSDISGTDVNCRLFEYNGKAFEVPPKEMIAESILGVVFGNQKSRFPTEDYKLPKNLRNFYEGKKNKKCSCKGDCCS
jgi:NAD-dependent dihydropyrimidine dehydrogenase PreA subunit